MHALVNLLAVATSAALVLVPRRRRVTRAALAERERDDALWRRIASQQAARQAADYRQLAYLVATAKRLDGNIGSAAADAYWSAAERVRQRQHPPGLGMLP